MKFPYTVRLFNEEIEQIDGAIHYAGLSCLVESKDFTDDVKINILRLPNSAISSYVVHQESLDWFLAAQVLRIQLVIFAAFQRNKASCYGMEKRLSTH